MFMERNRLDIVCIIPLMVQLGVVAFMMDNRLMDLLMSTHYGEVIVIRHVVMSRI